MLYVIEIDLNIYNGNTYTNTINYDTLINDNINSNTNIITKNNSNNNIKKKTKNTINKKIQKKVLKGTKIQIQLKIVYLIQVFRIIKIKILK